MQNATRLIAAFGWNHDVVITTSKDAGAFKKPKDPADYGFLAPVFIYICSRQLRFVSPNKSSSQMQNRPFIFKILYLGYVLAEGLIYSGSILPATNPNDALRLYFASPSDMRPFCLTFQLFL